MVSTLAQSADGDGCGERRRGERVNDVQLSGQSCRERCGAAQDAAILSALRSIRIGGRHDDGGRLHTLFLVSIRATGLSCAKYQSVFARTVRLTKE